MTSPGSDGAPLLRAENLTRVVQEKVLVKDATFSVEKGAILALVGPSGAGKSSLLRLLNRLDEPTGGTVYVDGTDYRTIAPRDLRRRLGMVTQRPYLFPGTVENNLQFGPKQRGEVLGASDVQSLLERVGLPGYRDRDVANLSGGEAQRVSFARTLGNSPEVLLLDEPTSALDDASKAGIEVLIQQIVQEDHLTCVVVTHDKAQAARLARRALMMESGSVVRQGDVREVLNA